MLRTSTGGGLPTGRHSRQTRGGVSRGGTDEQTDSRRVRDGAGGLRRDGVSVLELPAACVCVREHVTRHGSRESEALHAREYIKGVAHKQRDGVCKQRA